MCYLGQEKDVATSFRRSFAARSQPHGVPHGVYNSTMPEIVIQSDHAGQRVDVVVAQVCDLSRSFAARLIEKGRVRVNGRPVKPGRLLKEGEVLAVEVPPPEPSGLKPEDVPLEILYQDAHLVVINKPRGLVVHPGAGHSHGTLVHGLLARGLQLSGIGGVERPGIVHRLDKDTSGLMVVAADDKTHQALQAQIQARTARREYVAIVWGNPSFDEAVVDAAIGRDPEDRTRMAVLPAGARGARHATTELKVVERFDIMTLLRATLLTGRTHQIRVHCAYAGHPVVGDKLYGGKRGVPKSHGLAGALSVLLATLHLRGQALHAEKLSFQHPATGETMTFTAPLPGDMTCLLNTLRRFRSG